ncbi:MAG: hypothetical protein OHK0052_13190 [Anaerolineales bacterium]
MTVRYFDWRDLPDLHRSRADTLFLDSALLYTRGALQIFGALLASVFPHVGIHTAVVPQKGLPSLFGQLIHDSTEPAARLSFLAPLSALPNPRLGLLLDFLMQQAGASGALRVLAEVDERTPAFEGLRENGFAVYTRQQVWRLPEFAESKQAMQHWRVASGRDVFAIRTLYHNLVPALVQQVEWLSLNAPRGLVFYQQDELLAYVALKYGIYGIWAQPYLHPNVDVAAINLFSLLQNLPSRHNRPVYVCVSAYQSWMGAVLEDFGALAGPRQALMARHLAIQQRLARNLTLPELQNGQTETLTWLETPAERRIR